jgi:transcriptional regulator with XRE-family HTH domain
MNKKDIQRSFGRRLRTARSTYGITQEELADRAGLDRTYVSLVERGLRNLTLWNIHRLARGLELNPSELLQEGSDGT